MIQMAIVWTLYPFERTKIHSCDEFNKTSCLMCGREEVEEKYKCSYIFLPNHNSGRDCEFTSKNLIFHLDDICKKHTEETWKFSIEMRKRNRFYNRSKCYKLICY